MPIFILGAGFNADAASEAGPLAGESFYVGTYQINCGYPLVGEIAGLCFNLDAIPDGTSVESLFADAALRRDHAPLERLAYRLRKSDYYIASRLASDDRPNCYRRFFEAFEECCFLTFNYDSLPETILFRRGSWHPHDGYGVPIVVHLPDGKAELSQGKSSAQVLHLHGSLCVSTSECEEAMSPGEALAWLRTRDRPQYTFDPSSISANFVPFLRPAGGDYVSERVIAPIPDKAQDLTGAFVQETYTLATDLLREAGTAAAIGYSFSEHDKASYRPLLQALGASGNGRLLLVSPDASGVAGRIRSDFPGLKVEVRQATFRDWVATSFEGLDLCS